MAKKRAPTQDREHRSRVNDLQHAVSDSEQNFEIGNQAAQRDIARDGAPGSDLSSVMSAALPLAEQALLAVQILPLDGPKTMRFMEIIESSSLSEPRRDAILSRLQEDQAVADAVRAALENAFGVDNSELRASLWTGLDAAWNRLVDGDAPEEQLGLGGGSVNDNATVLVGDLTAERSAASLETFVERSDVSRSVQQFCRSIALLLHWEEEEEEELGEGVTPLLD